ncbi:sigma 54-interacting transcriptional regulator [Lacrimispora sp.]|uniref:sigma 54-interacting transcriptional regulator n=1 Tax=Lacrimispora sp. TaxID=2719234 RepID=UPI0028A729AF|nr:sigma 54-interacting transcriptional regulator [Lacrimispora sp.]
MEKSPRYHALIVCISAAIRLEFQSYLHSILGRYISFDTIDLYQVHTPSQITGYQCILFSSDRVQDEFPLPVPAGVAQFVCTRTFNHAFLDQIIRIPPGERVYLVNDTFESIPILIQQFRDAGITQYQFIPYYPGCGESDETIQYAVTVGEPQLVPAHIKNVINIGNRIIDISTINELCVCFHLPASLSNQITQGYINRILQITKLTETYYSNYIFSHQLLQAVIQNLPAGICLMSSEGEITMLNRQFSLDLDTPEANACGKSLSALLPDVYSDLPFCQSTDYQLESKSGNPLSISILELSLPNHPPLYLVTSKKIPLTPEQEKELHGRRTDHLEARLLSNGFSNILTNQVLVKNMLEYARRLALYDFPVLIQGESGTQKKMIAEAIHRASNRRQQPFAVLPGTTSPQLAGILSSAEKGTLLIDRAEYLSLEMQDFLIEVLQHGSQESGGFQSPPSSSFRIIATASHDLYEDVLKGTFREELFFLLNTASIDTIPLRERRNDIPVLMEHFFQNLFHDSNLRLKDIISPSLMEFLLSYDYPGNVQELLNLTRFFFTNYAAHPLILSQLPSYIRKRMKKPLAGQSAVKNSILTLIAASPRMGRSSIKEALARRGNDLSEGKLRSILKELSDEGLIKINRTRGGCEITELGMTVL